MAASTIVSIALKPQGFLHESTLHPHETIESAPGEGAGGGGTWLKEVNGDVPLDGGRIFTTGLTIMGLHF